MYDDNASVVKVLLELGANANIGNDVLGSPLVLAVQKKNEVEVRLLLARKVNVNAADGLGRTSLMIASEQGYTNIAYDLLRRNVDPIKKSDAGEAALSLATKNNHFDIVALLNQATQKPLEMVPDTDHISNENNVRYLVGTVINNTDGAYSFVEVDVVFLDANGVQVDSSTSVTANLAGGSLWKFKIPVLREDATSYKIVEIKGSR